MFPSKRGVMLTVSRVVELKTYKQWNEVFPIIKELRTDLTRESYLNLLEDMTKQGYTLFGLYEKYKLVSVAGVAYRVNFYNKRHTFVYDLVTSNEHRSHGYGEILLDYIHQWAREIGAEFVALKSGIKRSDAHRFYETKFDYNKWCYSFRKKV